MIYCFDGVVNPQCPNKEECILYGLKDECGPCPHYDEILEAFFSDLDG